MLDIFQKTLKTTLPEIYQHFDKLNVFIYYNTHKWQI